MIQVLMKVPFRLAERPPRDQEKSPSISLKVKNVPAGADFDQKARLGLLDTPDTLNSGFVSLAVPNHLTAFLDHYILEVKFGDNHLGLASHRDDDFQPQALCVTRPRRRHFAPNRSRRPGGIAQVPYRLGRNSEFFEPHGPGREVDSRERLIEPGPYAPEHRVVMGIHRRSLPK